MRKFVLVFMLALSFLPSTHSAFGQSVGIGGVFHPDPSAILHVKSLEHNKGVLFPRLTSEERDSINNPSNGLLIYNIDENSFNFFNAGTNQWESIAVPAMTTMQRDLIQDPVYGQTIFNLDEQCLDTWSGAEWFSICGSTPVAQASLLNCSAIAVGGTYIQGTPLTTANYLSIPVMVTSVRGGSYNILATTGNGYFFTASGVFPGAGTYNVNLIGAGMPTTATPAGMAGDTVAIVINNIAQSCNPAIPIMPAKPDYTIVGVTVYPPTSYLPNQPIDSTKNYLVVTLNVKTPGPWMLFASAQNGYSFKEQGIIAPNGIYPQIVTVIVPASGMPINAGSADNFTLTNPGSATTSNYNFVVKTASVSYAADCSSAVFNGPAMQQGVPLTGNESVTLPVHVAVPGAVPNGISATGAGITFSSGPVHFESIGDTTITLKPSGTPAPSESGDKVAFTLNGDGLTSACYLTNNIKGAVAVLTFNSYSYANVGSLGNNDGRWVMTKSINPLDTINQETPQKILLNVTISGNHYGSYNLTTGSVNGVTYSASGNLGGPGTYTIALMPTGAPTTPGTVPYKVTGNGINTTVTMSYSYRQFNIYSFTAVSGYGFYRNTVVANITNGTGTFGPGGKVPCQASPNALPNIATAPTAANLAAALNNNKIDILYLGYNAYNTLTDQATINVIKDFVFNKHGVLIWANEYAPGANGGATVLINELFNTALTFPVNGTVGVAYNGSFTSNASEIIQGPFGNLSGLVQTASVGNSGFIPNTNNIPNATILSTLCTGNAAAYAGQIMSIVHNKLGVYMSMDNTFYNATMPTTSVNTAGVPNLPIQGCVTTNSTNSALFANLFAWALHYGAYNIDPGYQVSATPSAASLAYPSTFVPRK